MRGLLLACLSVVALCGAATSADALTFSAPSGAPAALAGIPIDVVSADFNGDGKSDLAVSEEGVNDVRILLGDATGHFTQAPGSPVGGLTGVSQMAAGDINNDHKADLAAIVPGSSDGWATLQPDGTGTWHRYIGSKSAVGAGGPDHVAMADFDRDGNLDYAFSSFSGDNLVVVRGDGAGGTLPFNPTDPKDNPPFSGADPAPTQAPVALLTGDFNGDGYPDIATLESDSGTGAGTLEVWINQQATDNKVAPGQYAAADFQLAGSPVSLASATPVSLVSADFNHDSVPDFAVLNEDQSVSVVLGDGEGGYTAARTMYPLGFGFNTGAIAVGDLNGDGQPDLVSSGGAGINGKLGFMLGRGDGTFSNAGTEPAPDTMNGLAVADLNRDGKPDIAAVTSSSTSLLELLNSSKPELSLGATAVKFATQARTTLSAPRSLTVTNTGPVPIRPGSIRLAGAGAGDFIIDTSACRDNLLKGQSCALRVYFAPAATGTGKATLRLSNDLWQSVTLSGKGGSLPRGPRGPAGKPGRDGHVTCKVTSRKHVTCKVVYVTASHGRRVSARLVRAGRTVARGTLVRNVLSLRSTKHLRAGAYVLVVRFRLGGRTVTARQIVRIK